MKNPRKTFDQICGFMTYGLSGVFFTYIFNSVLDTMYTLLNSTTEQVSKWRMILILHDINSSRGPEKELLTRPLAYLTGGSNRSLLNRFSHCFSASSPPHLLTISKSLNFPVNADYVFLGDWTKICQNRCKKSIKLEYLTCVQYLSVTYLYGIIIVFISKFIVSCGRFGMTGNSPARGPFPVMVKRPHDIHLCVNHIPDVLIWCPVC